LQASGLTVRQIAEGMGCSVGFVHKTLAQRRASDAASKALAAPSLTVNKTDGL
jgi:hypothetical protein